MKSPRLGREFTRRSLAAGGQPASHSSPTVHSAEFAPAPAVQQQQRREREEGGELMSVPLDAVGRELDGHETYVDVRSLPPQPYAGICSQPRVLHCMMV